MSSSKRNSPTVDALDPHDRACDRIPVARTCQVISHHKVPSLGHVKLTLITCRCLNPLRCIDLPDVPKPEFRVIESGLW